MRPKTVVANWVHDEVLDYLASHCDVVPNKSRSPHSRAELIDLCRDADALIAFMPEMIDDAFLDACPKLQIVAGALKGYDNFDAEACTKRGLWLTIVPDLLTAPTAELTIGLLIAVARNFTPACAQIRKKKFFGWRPQFYGRTICNSMVGVVGMGALGKAVAKCLSGFDCAVLYHDVHRLPAEQERALYVEFAPLQKLQEESDFVILTLPLSDASLKLVDRAFLDGMRHGAYLINPARGSLVDEDAVADALDDGRLSGYAADVFAFEDWARLDRPTEINARLIQSDKTILTPHLGSAADDFRKAIAFEAAENVIQALKGERPKNAVNSPLGRIEP